MSDNTPRVNIDNDPRWPARKNPRTFSFIIGKDVVRPIFSAGNTEPQLPAGFYHAYTKLMPDGTRAYQIEPESVAIDTIRGREVPDLTRFFMEGTLSRIATGRNVGLLLSGLSGSGKTVQSRHYCRQVIKELGWPVIRIQDPTLLSPIAFDSLYTMIDGPAVYFFEEYDKTVLTACTNSGETPSDKVPQNHPAKSALLASMDKNGDYPSIFLLVCNEVEPLSDYLIARPGRVAYHIRYESLSRSIVLGWLNEKMQDRKKIPDVINLLNFMPRVSFDVIQELVTEINARPSLSVAELAKIVNIGELVPITYRVELVDAVAASEPGVYTQSEIKAARSMTSSKLEFYATMIFDKFTGTYRPMYNQGEISMKVNAAFSSTRLKFDDLFRISQKLISGATYESLAREYLDFSPENEEGLTAKESLEQAVEQIDEDLRKDSPMAIAYNALLIRSGETKPESIHSTGYDFYNGRYMCVRGQLTFDDENIVSIDAEENSFIAENPTAPGCVFEFTDTRTIAQRLSKGFSRNFDV